MKTALALILVAAAAVCSAADAYKWVDEKGVTNYGEKPPDAVPATPVSTEPRGVIETSGGVGQPRDTNVSRQPEARPIQVIPVPVQPSYAAAQPVRGMAFDIYIRLERGMTEGELLVRAGPPDHESMEGGWDYAAKTYYYFPTVADPFTTVVSLRDGRIANLQRIKKF